MRPREQKNSDQCRNAQIIRQWRILLALDHKQWFTLWELRDCLPKPRPHKRTIMRDMDALMSVFPIQQQRGDRTDGHGIQFEYRLQRSLASLLKK